MSVVKGESSEASPVLFLNKKGEPLRFFIRPGPTKTQLHPLITRCGGILSRTQESSTILLADPGEISTTVGSVGQFYISTQYIHDCVKQNQLLDIESYRFSQLQPVQTRMTSRKQKGNGRMCYSFEDDAAIMNFIAKRRHEAKGNRVWQQMERQRVTTHSWQSMKNRFLKHLQYKTSSKSPETKQKNNPLKESSSSEQNIPQSSPEPHTPKKTPTKAPIASSSGSDSMQVIPDVLTLTEDRTTGQSPLRSSPRKRNTPQCPYSGKDKPNVTSDAEKETPCGDEPEQEPLAEEHLHEQDSEEHEVSPKKARGNQDVPVEVTSERPDDDQLIPPCEIRQKHPSCGRSSEKKLGILERAAREFEDSQTDIGSQEDRPPGTGSSGSDSGSECQFTAAREMAVKNQNQPGHTEHPRDGDERSLLAQKSSGNRAPEDDGPGPSGATVAMASKAHMFLFDHESQEELTQPSQDEALSQDSMNAKLHVVHLMQESEKGLVEVMKALLKASGDVSLARTYLLGGYDRHIHGPIWTKEDDKKLLSCDSSTLRQLEEKFGAEGISKRQSFLKAK